MSTQFRTYTSEPGFTDDFLRVRDFLVRINRKNPIEYDFEWGRWEWAFSLPYLDTANLSKIGIWEADGEIVALATYEERPGSIYFCIDPAYHSLKTEMLLYAQKNLRSADGGLKILINNVDEELQLIAAKYGFVATQELEGNAVYDIDPEKIDYALPSGYSLISLSENCDLVKFNRVLWRGFNHKGEPPNTESDLADRRTSISGPHLNLDLCIVIVAPNGDYASYCGMWYDSQTEYALVEPVATDPDHRLLGLGKAAVLEGIRRCGRLGAKQAYVGSSQQFYYQIGFRPVPTSTFWKA